MCALQDARILMVQILPLILSKGFVDKMKTYDVIIIGFGKAGKTLAKDLSLAGKQVAMVEQSARMYGGTCINVACIPTKTLLQEALKKQTFSDAMKRKNEVVQALNQKNFDNLAAEDEIDLFTLRAEFESSDTIALKNPESGETIEIIQAKQIVINTGSRANILAIDGLDQVENIYDSAGIMEIANQPEHLVIIGAGYIALEFATIFRQFGTRVTIVHRDKHVLSKEERAIGETIYDELIAQGIEFIDEAETTLFEVDSTDPQQTRIHTSQGKLLADAVLLATGRQPNSDGLGLEAAGVEVNDGGEIVVNEHLQTSQSHIYAVGDVKGGPQFTYISLDDYRIVKSHLTEEGSRTTKTRGEVPYTLFIDPPLSRIGHTASAARKKGYTIKENSLKVSQIPRHKVNHDARGLFKVVVDTETDLILGASLYGKESEELINLIKLAMDSHIPYTRLRDQIYTHPTMAESFNDLFSM